jgi:eukaryotic-like serine/threonine-protein kinase
VVKDEAQSSPGAGVDRTVTHPSGRSEPSLAEHIYLPRGSFVDRYVLLDRIGAGGVGMVLEAYDPDLDRRIAIKLLHLRRTGDADGLLREGRAVAQLNHPNVVTVHDVGKVGGQVFIAMERIKGASLRSWLDAEPRDLGSILDVFAQAGRGLAAAHRAGIVHRDVKPSNILVGDDGRVRVVDFGLALGSKELDADGPARTISQTSVAGTPAYMSPEQHRGERLDARSDIFSFCVALWLAVFGERPFRGDTVAALRASVLEGTREPPPGNTRAPAWLIGLLERGLASDPDDRPASMDELLDELTRRRRRTPVAVVGGAIGIALAAAGLTWGLADRGAEPASLCQGAPDRIAEVWTAARAKTVTTAFTATAREGAGEIAAQVIANLDGYTADWSQMYGDACRATHERGEQSERLLDLRMRCLDRNLEVVDHLIDLFITRVDPQVIDRAILASRRLPPMSACDDEERLMAAVPPPAPELAGRVAPLETAIARAEALYLAGRYADVVTTLEPVLDDLDALDHAPLSARALHRLGQAYGHTERAGDTEETLARAARQAARGHLDDLSARIWLALLDHRINVSEEFARARDLVPVAETAIERAGNPPKLRGNLLTMQTGLANAESRFEDALALLEQARECYLEAGGDPADLADARRNLGALLLQLGEDERARTELEAAVTASEQAFGPRHAATGAALRYLAMALRRGGAHAESRSRLERALDIATAAQGPGSALVAEIHGSIATSAAQEGDWDAALEHFHTALAIKEVLLGAEHGNVGNLHVGIANVLKGKRKLAAARASFRRALPILEAAYGTGHPWYAEARYSAGELDELEGDCSAARRHYRAALAVFEEVFGPDQPQVANPLLGLASCALHEGAAADAIPYLERAMALVTHHDAALTATLRFKLGRALYESGRDRERGAELARAGFAALTDLGGASGAAADDARAWLVVRDLD